MMHAALPYVATQQGVLGIFGAGIVIGLTFGIVIAHLLRDLKDAENAFERRRHDNRRRA